MLFNRLENLRESIKGSKNLIDENNEIMKE